MIISHRSGCSSSFLHLTRRSAEASVKAEASGLLTRAGEMFKQVLEIEGWSSRALVRASRVWMRI